MLKNYMKRSILLLGAAAAVVTADAQAYRDVTGQFLVNPTYIPGWQGALTATANGVAEVYNGAFNLYQVLPDMEAGTYTLKADAFYRCGNNDFSAANMTEGKNHFAYIYINDKKVAVKGLFDGRTTAPNSTGEAATAFAANEYTNEVEVNHPGGDMIIGIMNEGGYADEWCCFDNFKLFEGTTDMTEKIANPNFVDGFAYVKDQTVGEGWEITNADKNKKIPDFNNHGGAYRKTNASPYNYGQQVTLPAGKYRFSMLTFHRYGGAGNLNGKIITVKGAWGIQDISKSPKDWFEEGKYDEIDDNTYAHAYIYMSQSEAKPTNLKWNTSRGGQLNPATDKRTRVKCSWELNNGDYANIPENETRANSNNEQIVPTYGETRNIIEWWDDSGKEREAAAAFVNEPEKYFQYVEFELPAETTVWLGHGKNSNSSDQYWHTWADIKLEKWDADYKGINGSGTSAIESIAADFDANAPVEYFNMQGVRVAEPTTGLYIVRQGNKVSKQLIRK